jgi:dihydrofolate synthase / folylpolyglutamate synthase
MSHTADYQDAIASLSRLIPELLVLPAADPASPPIRRKFSLNEIAHLCAALGNPQSKFPSVLIAGTNGKGSTASTLASIATQSGLRTGLYTSPHLERVNERIKLGDPVSGIQDIPDDIFAALYFRVHAAAQQLVLDRTLPALPSYFELLTALAFLYFAESQVDLAILEVGMGGRLDATNIVTPILSVITDISLDHQEWLGASIDLIAREKAGILRPNGTLVTLPQHPEANQAIGEAATQLHVRAISAVPYMPPIHTGSLQPYPLEVMGQTILVDSPLKGAHQHRNLALAIASAVELAQHHNFPITPKSIERGIRQTHWPARLERIHISGLSSESPQPEFILDVAHNPAGAWALRAALSSSEQSPGGPNLASEMWDGTRKSPGAPGLASKTRDRIRSGPRVLIFSCLRDKPLREMTQILFPIFDHVVLAPIHSPRATDLAGLAAAAEATGVSSTQAATVEEALQIARNLNPATIVVSGSLYLVGEARALLLKSSLGTTQGHS